jgi:3-hydroxyisobutyrate dehydrogenase-like beta-hydroxyacid dehydrogenase
VTALGVVGLGRMGSAMAFRWAEAGLLSAVFNRSRGRVGALAARGGVEVAESPRALANRCDVIVTMLADGPATREVLEGPDGLASGMADGTLMVNMATTSRAEAIEFAEIVGTAGGRYVDAPVSGSVATAAGGGLTVMAGGDAGDVADAQPVFDAVSGRVFHLGPVGAGAAMKLAVNSMLFGINQALSESLVLAERAGIDRSAAYDVIASSAVAAPVVHYRREIFEFPGERPVTFTIDLARKDLSLVLDMAGELGTSMPQAEVNAGFMDDASSKGWGDADMGDVARVLRGEVR